MKNKFNLLIITLLICITTIFAGCTKADKASYSDIKSKFNTELSSSVTIIDGNNHITQTGSAILVKLNNGNYYFEFSPDNADLLKKVNENGNRYHKLSDDEIYAKLLSYSSNYFCGKLMNSNYMVAFEEYLGKVPQKNWTALWNSTDDTINQIKDFGEKYRKLSSCYRDSNANSTNAVYALENLLKQYKNLIGSVLQQNLDAQDIFDNYLFQNEEVTTTVSQAQINRIIDAYKLYFTEYLYQRYMVFDSETQITINSALLNKLDQIANIKISTNSSQVDVYKYLLLVEKSMRNEIELNRNAVKILKGKVPASSDKDFDYKNLVYQDFVSFEQTLIGYAEDLLTIING